MGNLSSIAVGGCWKLITVEGGGCSVEQDDGADYILRHSSR